VLAEEAKNKSTHDVFSGDCQFFFMVGVSNAEVHIGEFADFSQAFRLREASIIVSTETGSSVSVRCSGSFACGGVWLALFSVSCGRRFLQQAKTELPSDTVQLRHNGIRRSVSD
jgi:hypothetical protein